MFLQETKVSSSTAYYSCAAAILALCTWVWVSVLLAYNNRRKSEHSLALALLHFVSFVVFAALWSVLGVLLLTETRFSCGKPPYLGEGTVEAWCGMTITTGTLGLVLWLLSTAASLVISTASRKSSLGLRSSIVAFDGEEDPGPLKGPMQTPTAVRTALYSLIIVFGVLESGIAVFHALLGSDTTERVFVSLAAGFSLISWIWASVLLAYHRRPLTRRTLTRASTHFYTLAVLCVLELAVAIMVLARTRRGCDSRDDFEFCWVRGVNGGLSMGLSATLAASASYVYFRTVREGESLSESNVARFDGEMEKLSNDADHMDLKLINRSR
ncbi:hypothetical protein L218DRAFT_134355 [Marasmius fiardii PR-910]|nr:hypothetical protein L218DRAFT_134355 [Marasmius fiardii PR-910]